MCLKMWPYHLLRWEKAEVSRPSNGDAAGWRSLAGVWGYWSWTFPEPLSIHMSFIMLTTHVFPCRLSAPPVRSHMFWALMEGRVLMGPGVLTGHLSLSQVCIPF